MVSLFQFILTNYEKCLVSKPLNSLEPGHKKNPARWRAPSKYSDKPAHPDSSWGSWPPCFSRFLVSWLIHLSCLMTKPTKWLCAQRRLSSGWAFAQSHQSSVCAQWVAKDPSFLHADCEDWSDWADAWVFAGRTCHFVGFVMRPLNLKIQNIDGSNIHLKIYITPFTTC